MKPLGHAMARGKGLTLQHFMLQSEISKSYRQAVRATRALPDISTRRETLDFLRIDLEKLRGVSDISTIRSTLADFNRNNKHFIPSLGLSSAGMVDQKPPRLIGQKIPRHQTLVRRFFA
ncbi:hypothetical protein NliqN6_3390 [Naganishia liquefaciens]|uniref:Uncharacterized protein n=1 Tax=Naganishia liquefaciens TaxID=104408 RepID=A0A8H3TU82_9TREE|nr:hypothetical protein NliqN6_3390 [Naganishia liquefaciens]